MPSFASRHSGNPHYIIYYGTATYSITMKIDQLTFTRFLAAISIVIFHFGQKVTPFSYDTVSFLFQKANIGVSFFFILSGFVMIIAYGRKGSINPAEYLRNRFGRIYPVYMVAICLLAGNWLFLSLPVDTTDLMLNIFMVQSWIPGKALSFNSPGWSLSVEFFFYFLFPFLFNRIYSRYGYKKTILPILLIWIASQAMLHVGLAAPLPHFSPEQYHDLLFYFPVMHLSQFLIGNLAGFIYIDKLAGRKRNTDLYILLTVAITSLLLKYDFGFNYHNGVLGIVFVPFILLMSVNNGYITRLFSISIFVFLGEISYGIYILQRPVYVWTQGIMNRLHIQNSTVSFYISFVSLIALSALCYVSIEAPLRRMIKKIRIPGSPVEA